MTAVVVEVGPATIRGPNDVPVELEAAAFDGIDDDVVLLDEHPVAVEQVWRDALRSAVGGSAACVAVVCPAWWSSTRIALVCDAARTVAATVVELHRNRVLAADSAIVVVEIAADFVVVYRAGEVVGVEVRSDDPDTTAGAVSRTTGPRACVLVDAPDGVAGAERLGAAIADRLRAPGSAVSVADPQRVRRMAGAILTEQQRRTPSSVVETRSRRVGPGVAAPAAAVLSTVALYVLYLAWPGGAAHPVAEVPMTLLVEGRVAVKVPARWTVQRITSGPGSARVQIVSPTDSATAVHLTQSPARPNQTPAVTAATLRKALDEQPAGVFVDFDPDDRRADRAVVTYREIRAGHHVRWAVLVDGTVRIAIGCQSPPGREDRVEFACVEAVESAHAVF